MSNIKHNLSKHPLYNVYTNIIYRLSSENTKNKASYSDKNINMCVEWRESPKAFIDWCESNGYSKGMEIDRRDNDLDYSPDNCRFTSRSVNARNTRKIMATNTSGYRGVSWNKQIGKWITQIRSYGKQRYLGCSNDAKVCAKLYDDYVLQHSLEHTINGV